MFSMFGVAVTKRHVRVTRHIPLPVPPQWHTIAAVAVARLLCPCNRAMPCHAMSAVTTSRHGGCEVAKPGQDKLGDDKSSNPHRIVRTPSSKACSEALRQQQKRAACEPNMRCSTSSSRTIGRTAKPEKLQPPSECSPQSQRPKNKNRTFYRIRPQGAQITQGEVQLFF